MVRKPHQDVGYGRMGAKNTTHSHQNAKATLNFTDVRTL